MTSAEFQILTYVVDVWVRFHWLMDESIAETLNKPFHNLGRSDLIATLNKLFQESYIIARRDDTDGDFTYFTPTTQEIEQALRIPFLEKSLFNYGLTSKGGEFWGKSADPDWDKYVCSSYGIYYPENINPYPQQGEIITSTRTFTKQQLDTLKWLREPIYRVLSETEIWDEVRPWQATYWKSLPVGYRVKFLYTDESLPEARSLEEVRTHGVTFLPWYKGL